MFLFTRINMQKKIRNPNFCLQYCNGQFHRVYAEHHALDDVTSRRNRKLKCRYSIWTIVKENAISWYYGLFLNRFPVFSASVNLQFGPKDI